MLLSKICLERTKFGSPKPDQKSLTFQIFPDDGNPDTYYFEWHKENFTQQHINILKFYHSLQDNSFN